MDNMFRLWILAEKDLLNQGFFPFFFLRTLSTPLQWLCRIYQDSDFRDFFFCQVTRTALRTPDRAWTGNKSWKVLNILTWYRKYTRPLTLWDFFFNVCQGTKRAKNIQRNAPDIESRTAGSRFTKETQYIDKRDPIYRQKRPNINAMHQILSRVQQAAGSWVQKVVNKLLVLY